MILVTLGTQDKPFTRLLDAIQKNINNGVIKDRVVVQAGMTPYQSKDMEIFDLLPMDKFDALINQCDLLITHGGVGSILNALKLGKTVIAVPRLAKYKEHENDHQVQIIEKFSHDGYIIGSDPEHLNQAIEKSKLFKPKSYTSNNNNMIKLVKDFIDNN